MAITHVQDWSKTNASGASSSLTISPTAGNLCILIADPGNQGGVAATSVVDSHGDSWTFAVNDGSQGYYTWVIAYKLAVASGVTSVTLTPAANFDAFGTTMIVMEFSWGGTTGASDGATSGYHTNSSATTHVSDALTPSTAADLSVGLFFNNDAQSGFTDSGGYTAYYPGSLYLSAAWKVLSSSSSNQAQAATASGITSYVHQALFKPDTGLGIDQDGFRFRNDDGSETTATWAAAQNGTMTAGTMVNRRLRFLLQATADPAASQFRLEYRKSGTTPWRTVP